MSGRSIQLVTSDRILLFVAVWWLAMWLLSLVMPTAPLFLLGVCQYVTAFVYLRARAFTWRYV